MVSICCNRGSGNSSEGSVEDRSDMPGLVLLQLAAASLAKGPLEEEEAPVVPPPTPAAPRPPVARKACVAAVLQDSSSSSKQKSSLGSFGIMLLEEAGCAGKSGSSPGTAGDRDRPFFAIFFRGTFLVAGLFFADGGTGRQKSAGSSPCR